MASEAAPAMATMDSWSTWAGSSDPSISRFCGGRKGVDG